MPHNQTDIFSNFEGDRWFGRNREALAAFDPTNDPPLRVVELYDLRPRSVLEVGAANGFRVAEIARRENARAVAVDVSKEAVREGKKQFPNVEFVCGAAHAVPLEEVFDLVIVNFVLHWVDRSMLLRSVAEIDRLLAENGHLIIGDFHPANFLQVPYHHLAGEPVRTYKQNYAAPFVASGLYHAVGLLGGGHSAKTPSATAGESERSGVWLLQKQLTGHYMPSGSGQ